MTSDLNSDLDATGEYYIEEPLSAEWQRFLDAWHAATPEEKADVKQFVADYHRTLKEQDF